MFVCLFVAYLGWTFPGSSLRMRGLRTAAVLRHKGPAVPTSASFCLQKSHACWVSACCWTPRLSLGHPGSFRSTHDLKCMRTQSRPWFKVMCATIRPNCRVLIKILHIYVLLNIYDALIKFLSSKLSFESSLPWKRHFSTKFDRFVCGKCRFQ